MAFRISPNTHASRTILVRIPVGAARKLEGSSIDVQAIMTYAADNDMIKKSNMPEFQFRYIPFPAEITNEMFDTISRVFFPRTDIDIVGRFAGVLISRVLGIPVLPSSGWLPTESQLNKSATLKREKLPS
jgi:hypothetical protein